MKPRLIVVILIVIGLLAALSSVAAAQGPEPRVAAQQNYGPPQPDAVPTGDEAGPFARWQPAADVQTAAAGPAVAVGQPGLSFRYVRTFGETLVPYLADNSHLFRPWGVTVNPSGNVYITEGSGHRMMKFAANGDFLMSIGQAGVWFANNTNRISGPRGVAVDHGGNVWIVETGSNRVSKWDATGKYVSQLGQTSNQGSDNSHFRNPSGIAFDGTGYVYVGDNNNNRVQVFDGSGSYVATLGTGSCGTANNQFCSPQGVAVDSAGRLYVADRANHRVQVFDSNRAYLTTIGMTGMCGQANNQLCQPQGVAIGPDGKVYVVDSQNNRVQILMPYPALSYVATLGVTGQWGSDNTHFGWPIGVAVDASSNVYVAEEDNSRVQKFDSNRNYVRTFGVTGVPYLTDNLHFMNPTDAAVDPAGNLIVLEEAGQRFIKLDPNGTPLFAVGSPGNPSWSESGFCWPNAIATDGTGRIYLANTCNNRIQIYGTDGAHLATVGTGYGTGNTQFKSPQGVVVGNNGYLYVADTDNHRIQVFDSSYTYVATIGQTGVAGADNTHFNRPLRPAVDKAGNIYVADANNLRVQKCTLAGVCSTFAGVTGVSGGGFDHFSEPDGVAVDSQGRVYVVDQHNRRIQVYDQNGAYLTTIGGSYGTANGQNSNPVAVEVDAAGNVYIVDQSIYRIQKFAPGTPGWRQVNINGFGDWTNGNIHTLASFGGQLYAGTFNSAGKGAQMWRIDAGGNWAQPISAGFGITRNIGINHLAAFNGRLYAGVRNDQAGAQVYRSSDGNTWDPVATAGFGDPQNTGVYRLALFGGQLYAGTSSWTTGHGGEIWRSPTGNNGSWARVVNGGFDNPNHYIMRSSEVHDGYLYFGTQNMTVAGGIVIRTSTGDSGNWNKVTLDGFGDGNNFAISGLASFNGYLYASTTRWDNSGIQVWRCQTCDSADSWQKVVDNGFGNPYTWGISTLHIYKGVLYLVTGNGMTGMEVWRTSTGNSSEWTQISAGGFGDSNNSSPYYNNVTTFNDHLVIGTQNGANAPEVWMKTLTADFTATPTRGAPPLVVQFANTSSGDFTTSQWDFGDGGTSTAISPTHTYTAAGTYTVTLTVGDGTDTSTITKPGYIVAKHFTYLPLVMKNYDPLLYDDFNDPAWDGAWNPAKWGYVGSGWTSFRQQGGVLVVENSTPSDIGGGEIQAARWLPRSPSLTWALDIRLKMSSNRKGGWSSVQPKFHRPVNGHGWTALCSLGSAQGLSSALFDCGILVGQGNDWTHEYQTNQIAVAYDTWHVARIEIAAGTAEVRFYLDGQLVGSHLPDDADALKAATEVLPAIALWNGDVNATASRYVDDVRITPAR